MAKSKTLEDLFEGLLKELGKQLKEGRKVLTKSGDVEQVSPDAATLNVIRQLLKDNGIEATEENDALKGLRNSLPFASDDDNDSSPTHLN
jgi:hypothetical protein